MYSQTSTKMSPSGISDFRRWPPNRGGWLLNRDLAALDFRKNSIYIVYWRITIFSNFFFIGIVVSFMNVGMKYFEYYILYVSIWLFVICFVLFCFFFCNGYYMDINAGTAFLNAALLLNSFSFLHSACWEFFFHYFTVFWDCWFCYYCCCCLQQWFFLEYGRLQITRTFKGNREFELSGARRK